ncbi:MAG: lamin tail domain-containing protein [Saprospiraceae bacterium]|nr:lamin tail domain-containing protein [Saprospiraceae bacterium]
MKLLPVLLLFPFVLTAQIRLTEVAPSNTGQLVDEDNDRPDWIEIQNGGNLPANLQGWALSDGGFASRWILPETNIEPGERIIVFASGKNRGQDAGGNGIDHWETAVYESNIWHYRLGTAAPPSDWKQPVFNPAGWSTGPGGFGYGDGDDATIVPNGTVAVYYRYSFDLSDPSIVAGVILSMDYDDGFVAYLNGVEIARSGNIPGTPDHTTLASQEREVTGTFENYSLNTLQVQNLMNVGANTLAVEIHNVTLSSSDLSGRTFLHLGMETPTQIFGPVPSWFNPGGTTSNGALHTDFKLNFSEKITLFDPSGNIVDSLTIGQLQPGHARMRLNDDGPWCITDNPTPGATNGWDCPQEYAALPGFALPAGFYQGTQSLPLTGSGTIRYTTDGSEPDASSQLYTSAISIPANTVVKARQFESGKLPSAVAFSSYLIDENVTLPVVSITIPPDEFSAVYDNYSDKGALSVEYFDNAGQRKFSDYYAGYVVGNWSVGFPQKSLQFDVDEEFGSTGEIKYPIFSPDKPIQSYHSFRIRNEDDDWTQARMRDRIVNELAAETHAGRAAFRNVIAFINGQYWGHYVARERLDHYFVRDNYGANPDSVNMVKTHFGQGDYVAEYGTIDDFYAMSDFIWNNDMSNVQQFQAASTLLDLDNFTDYMQTEIYVASTDWLQDYFNNFRLFKTKKNAPWKFLLWDVSYSSGNPNGGSACSSCDVLSTTLSNDSRYGRMLRSLLDNQTYRQFFINRFADLMNTAFASTRAHQLIDQSASEISPEIERHDQRWGTGNFNHWSQAVQVLKNFYTQRPNFQRQHIREAFNLVKNVNVTLDVNPPGAGAVKISTVIPDQFPWTGIYFDGNPVTVTVIPNPGFTFSNWTANSFITNATDHSFTVNITSNTTFTANFSGQAANAPLTVSEINYHPEKTLGGGDWFELRNDGAVPIDLSGYFIGDQDWYHRFEIPTGTVVPAQGHLVVCENPQKFQAAYPGVSNYLNQNLGFELSDASDEVRIIDRLGNLYAYAQYDDQSPWPALADGWGLTLEYRDGAQIPNAPESWFNGCVGGSPGENYQPCLESGWISEVNYHSADNTDAGDWIELHNPGNQTLDLSGWAIRDADDLHEYIIPAGTLLSITAPYLVVVEDQDKFEAQHPGIAGQIGPLGFGLSNSSDMIRLYRPDGKLALCMLYRDLQPWPEEPDGTGKTLEKLQTETLLNDPVSWIAGCPGGSPGKAYDPNCVVSGVNETPEEVGFNVWPNPASDLIWIECTEDKLVECLDLTGRRIGIWRLSEGVNSRSVVHWPQGMYFIRELGMQRVNSVKWLKK